MENNFLLVLDVDGVITDPRTKKASNASIFEYLKIYLNQSPLLLNTGRSDSWIKDNITSQIQASLTPNNFFCTCEMGAVILQYDEGGPTSSKLIVDDIIPGLKTRLNSNQSS